MIEIQCSDCRFNIKAKDALAGKTVLCPECKAKVRIPGGEHDLEVVADEPRPPNRQRRRPMGDDDDEIDDRRRRRFRHRRKQFELEPMHIYVGLGVFALLLVLAIVGFKVQPIAALVALAAMLICSGAGIWLMIIAFREDTVCGLLYIFAPFYGLYYVFTRWDDCKVPFAINVAGFVVLVVCFIAIASHEPVRRPPNRWGMVPSTRGGVQVHTTMVGADW